MCRVRADLQFLLWRWKFAVALSRAGKRDLARPVWEKVLVMAESYHDATSADRARAELAVP